MTRTAVGNGGVAVGALGARRLVVVVAGMFLLACALSPKLRADLGGIVALTAVLGEAYAAGVRDFVLSFGVFSPVAYVFAMVVQVFAAPIPSAPVSLAGSLVFGVWEGFGLSLAGSLVGSVLAFLAARRWGEPRDERLVGREALRRYAGGLDGRGLWLFVVLAVPFMPDDAAVALAGLSRLPFWWFLPLMVAGRVPGHATTALLASEWVTGSAVAWISAGIAIAAVLALTLVYKERLESRMFHRADGGQTDAGSATAASEGGAMTLPAEAVLSPPEVYPHTPGAPWTRTVRLMPPFQCGRRWSR